MRYIGWIILIVVIIFNVWFYKYRYQNMHRDIAELKREISMWEELMAKEKNAREGETKFTFTMAKFFESNGEKLSPYGEIELSRILKALKDKRVEIIIYSENPTRYLVQILKFISEQNLSLNDFRVEGKRQADNRLVIIVR